MIDFMLGFMKKPQKLSALPSKEQAAILSQAVSQSELKQNKEYMRYLYLVVSIFLASAVTVGIYYQSLRVGAMYFVVAQWFFWYLIARKAKPLVYEKVPEEYR